MFIDLLHNENSYSPKTETPCERREKREKKLQSSQSNRLRVGDSRQYSRGGQVSGANQRNRLDTMDEEQLQS